MTNRLKRAYEGQRGASRPSLDIRHDMNKPLTRCAVRGCEELGYFIFRGTAQHKYCKAHRVHNIRYAHPTEKLTGIRSREPENRNRRLAYNAGSCLYRYLRKKEKEGETPCPYLNALTQWVTFKVEEWRYRPRVSPYRRFGDLSHEARTTQMWKQLGENNSIDTIIEGLMGVYTVLVLDTHTFKSDKQCYYWLGRQAVGIGRTAYKHAKELGKNGQMKRYEPRATYLERNFGRPLEAIVTPVLHEHIVKLRELDRQSHVNSASKVGIRRGFPLRANIVRRERQLRKAQGGFQWY